MDKSTITEKLIFLKGLNNEKDNLDKGYEQGILSLIPKDKYEEYNKLCANYNKEKEDLNTIISDTQTDIKKDVLNLGESVKSDGVSAIYYSAGTIIDSHKVLSLLEKMNIEINVVQTQKQPYVVIR